MASKICYTIRGNDDEVSNFDVYLPDLTALNYGPTVLLIDSLDSLIADVTKGNIVGKTLSQNLSTGANTRPADPYAQTEIKFRIKIRDQDTNRINQISIPAADLDVLATEGTEEITSAIPEADALFTWLETNAVTALDNALLVESARYATVKG